MSSREEQELESPFLSEELFIEESGGEWEARLTTLEVESPFLRAFEQGLEPAKEIDLFKTAFDPQQLLAHDPIEREIIEPDTREYVGNTSQVPFRWICSLEIYRSNPQYPQGPKWLLRSKATGVLIGSSCVLTAAHNLWDTVDGKNRPVERVVITPGRNGDDAPFGKSAVGPDDWRTPTGWDPKKEAETRMWDFAVIHLKDAPGNKVFNGEQFGWWGSARYGHGTSMKPLKAEWLKNRVVRSAGYPGDRCGTRVLTTPGQIRLCQHQTPDEWASTQWYGRGKVLEIDGRRSRGFLNHTIDTTKGQSGSPIWYYYKDNKSGQARRWLVGLHVAPGTMEIDGSRKTRFIDNRAIWIGSETRNTIADLEAQLLRARRKGSREIPRLESSVNESEILSETLDNLPELVEAFDEESEWYGAKDFLVAQAEAEDKWSGVADFLAEDSKDEDELTLVELEEEFVEEQEWADTGDFPLGEAEACDDVVVSDLEDRIEEVYEENEIQYMEGETGKEKPLTRMKFEFQTKNLIWRNDGKASSGLERKYGPYDFLVDQKGVRLESETNNGCPSGQRCGGVLEFETEWFRSRAKLAEAIDKAVKMTEEMRTANPSRYDTTRKAFPFNVDHLRRGTRQEMKQCRWNPANYPRYENRHWNKEKNQFEFERILGAGEELEVELIDPSWEAGIQSSEGFLLEYYESFLRQHEWPFYRDGAVKHAKAILDAVNTTGIPVTEIAKLRSFLQIIVNYIMRGQGGEESNNAGAFANVKGLPAKQAFTLMSRTSFASIYRSLLTDKEKKLFQKIVKNGLILNEMRLNQQSRVFIQGYGTTHHEPGPTVHTWLSRVLSGVDLLSARSGKGLSASMGRYDVKTRKGEKDRWLVKFETRNTVMGAFREAKDWGKYASDLFDLASRREGDVVHLLTQQGITDENKLTNLIFFARHPEMNGRRIRSNEKELAQKWLQIRNQLVRPILQSRNGSELFVDDLNQELSLEALQGETELAEGFVEEFEQEVAQVAEDFIDQNWYESEEWESFYEVESVEGESEEEATEPLAHPSLKGIGEIDIRHRNPVSSAQFEGEDWYEQFDSVAPAKLVQLDHWHVPLTPNPATGGFTAGSPAILLKADMNPGFVDSGDALITDTSANGLQSCLSKLVQAAGARFLAAKTSPSMKDRIRVAVVDLTGNRLNQPEFAGWGSTVAMYGASTPKILGLYAAFQVRSDVRRIADQGGITNGIALEKEAKAVWKAKKLPQVPDLVWLFDIRKWDITTGPVDFTATAIATFKEIMHNCPAGTIIAKASLPFIGSLAWQSGLYHAQRGGLWLKASYCSKGSWSSTIRVPTSHNITALSAATFFALLAQERLVDAASSADIKNFLRGGCTTSLLPSTIPVVASKCGLWSEFVHDCLLVDDGTVRYAAAVLSRLKTRDDVAAYKKVWTELDALIRKNNQSPKPAC